jgi:hypothetical protein
MCWLIAVHSIAQVRPPAAVTVKHHHSSDQLKDFFHFVAQANATFVYPRGFKEIKAPDDEDFSYDYALELPGRDFEIWFLVKSEKEDWFNYLRTQNNKNSMANPDSVYKELGKSTALTFTDQQAVEKTLAPDALARYNADEGKTYLLTLLDLPQTKHYKYALLITLQKNHTGTILAVCFSNEKGPEFFKNLNRASHCLRFK